MRTCLMTEQITVGQFRKQQSVCCDRHIASMSLAVGVKPTGDSDTPVTMKNARQTNGPAERFRGQVDGVNRIAEKTGVKRKAPGFSSYQLIEHASHTLLRSERMWVSELPGR